MIKTYFRSLCVSCFLLLFFACENITVKREIKSSCPPGYRCQQIKEDLEMIVVKTFIKLNLPSSEKVDAHNLYLTADGVSIAYDNGDIENKKTTFEKKLPLSTALLQAEKINILLSSHYPTRALISLTRIEGSKSEIVATGMVHLGMLMGDGIVHVNDATTFTMRLAKEKFVDPKDFRCVIEPYHRLLDFFQKKLGEAFIQMSLAELKQLRKNDPEVETNIKQIVAASKCHSLPHENQLQFSTITLSLNLTKQKIFQNKNLKARIRREDGYYLPIMNDRNSKTYEFTFTTPQLDKNFVIKFKALDRQGPPFGTIEIVNNEAVVLSALVSLKKAFSGEPIALDTNSMLPNHLEKARTVKFVVAHASDAKKTYYYQLQREDQLFIPNTMNSQTNEIEFLDQGGLGWTHLRAIDNQNIQLETLVNLSSVSSRNQGVTISVLGNTIIGLLTEHQPLTSFEGECLYFHYNEFARVIAQYNQGHENDSILRITPEMQQHLNQFKKNDICLKKRPQESHP
ncbi:MAG: hypothetical protein AABY86_00200 [Bdellovibrionota bacterium]